MTPPTSFVSRLLVAEAAMGGLVRSSELPSAAGRSQLEVLQSILDSMAEGAIALDESGRVLFFNSAAKRILRVEMTGVTLDQWPAVCGFILPDKVTPYPPDRLPLARAIRGEAVDDAEVFVRHGEAPEGMWLVVSARPLRDPGGALIGGLVVFRDVTRNRQAEEALRASEERNRTLLENVSELIWIVEASGTLRYQSPGVYQLLGYQPEELMGTSVFDLVHPDDLSGVVSVHREALENPGTTYKAEFRCRHRDGTWRTLEGAGKALPDQSATVVTSRDVTERRRAEDQVRFQASLLDQVRNAVIAFDTQGRIVYWNRCAEMLHQWTREEVVGRNTREMPVPLLAPDRLAEVIAGLRESGYWEGEALRMRKDGSSFPAIVNVAEVRDAHGKLIGFISVSADISERKQVEEDLRASREQLRKLAARQESVREAERARIARDVHDDLGQALTALKMELSHAAKKAAEDEDLLAPLRSAAQLVDATISSVQRIASDLRPSILDDFGLAAAIEWQAREFQSRTGIKVELAGMPGNLRLGRTVSTALFRMFQEVLTNVARHAQASVVTISLKDQADGLVLNVRDDGVGITEARANAPNSLGLAGMRERALALGGELEILGGVGGGTAVTVWIPHRLFRRKGSSRPNRNGRARTRRTDRC